MDARGWRRSVLPSLLLLLPIPGPMRASSHDAWQQYTRVDRHYRYQVEYPSTWSVEESGNTAFFLPPSAASRAESIAIVAIDYRATPPPPVHYTYTTVRAVVTPHSRVLVRTRDPAPVTERYFAQIQKGDYTIEFRCSLDLGYDDVFDHMLATFQ